MTKKAKGRFYQDVAFRSEKDDWHTPYELYETINSYFNFECDVCANDDNALCDNYFTKEFSCLTNEWYQAHFQTCEGKLTNNALFSVFIPLCSISLMICY